MSEYWADLALKLDGLYTAEDFESAAYRLVAEQVIYHADRNNKISYSVINLYEKEFNKVLGPLGLSITVNHQYRYVAAIPRHAKSSTASVAQTLFSLVLRGIHEDGARGGDQTEEGEVICDYIELQEKYRLMTGRDLPAKGELDGLLRTARRWGIVRQLEEDEGADLSSAHEHSTSGIAIRHAIIEVLGETSLMRLAQWGVVKGEEVVDADEGMIQQDEGGNYEAA